MPLSISEKHSIERKSNQLIAQNNIEALPIPVEEIAVNLGLDVVPYDLGNGVSGALIIENHKGFIGYNPTHPRVRQRFTIAHELGHFYMHNLQKENKLFVDKDFIIKYRSGNNYTLNELKQEQEANAFAAALLMPKDFIMFEIKQEKYYELPEHKLIEKLAKTFDVSVLAMTFRLSDLQVLL